MTTSPLPRPGKLVSLQGLKSKPELNGRVAIVLPPTHSKEAEEGYSRGRVPVSLQGEQLKTMLLKPESLVLVSDNTPEYETLCSSAWAAFERRKIDESIKKYKAAITLMPSEFTAHFQLGQVLEASDGEVPGALELAAQEYLEAMELTAPESASPDFTGWTHSFVRAANMLKVLPAAAKPKWWSPHGLKERCGLVLANPQGYAPDSSLMSPAWQITGHAFEMENNNDEAAKAYDTAAGYEMDRERCNALQRRASELKSS